MSDRSIVKIERSDSDERFRMKCNANFQQLSMGPKADGQLRSIVLETVGGNAAEIINMAFDVMYPIGAGIWTNTLDDTRLQRGRWRQVKDRFILTAGSAHPFGESGGAEKVTLAKTQMPAHAHTGSATSVGAHSHTVTIAGNGAHVHGLTINSGGSHAHTASASNVGDHQHYENARNDLMPANTGDDKHAAIGSVAGWKDNFYRTKAAGAHGHTITVASGGAHSHGHTLSTAGSHGHTASVSSASAQAPSITIGSEGGGQPHENMPPYDTRYYFERIA